MKRLSSVIKLVSILWLSIGSQAAFAEAATFQGKNLVFDTMPVMEVKTDKSNIYAFKYATNQEYTLKANITNMSEHQQKYRVELLNAFDNQNGQIVYQANSAKNGLRNLAAKPTKTGTVGGHQAVEVELKLTAPKTPLNGVKLGGFGLTEVSDENTGYIKNDISFVTSVLLSADDDVETSDLSTIKLLKVNSIYSKNEKGYQVSFKNSGNKIITNMSANININNQTKQVLKNISVTPDSEMTLFVPDEQPNNQIKTAKVTLKKDKQSRVLTYKGQTTPVVKADEKSHSKIYIVLGIVLLIILGLGGFTLIRRGGKNGQ